MEWYGMVWIVGRSSYLGSLKKKQKKLVSLFLATVTKLFAVFLLLLFMVMEL